MEAVMLTPHGKGVTTSWCTSAAIVCLIAAAPPDSRPREALNRSTTAKDVL